MYKTYSYKDMPMQVRRREEKREQNVEKKKDEERDNITERNEEAVKNDIAEKKKDCKPCDKQNGLLDNLETDDLILLVVALVLLMDDCDDKMLIAAIAFIFLSDTI